MASNNTNLISSTSPGHKSNTVLTRLSSKGWQGCISSGEIWGESVRFFPASGGCPIPWLVAPSSVFKASEGRLSPFLTAMSLHLGKGLCFEGPLSLHWGHLDDPG